MESDVVLPAPLGPTRPARDPAAISRSIPATASFLAKLLRSPCTAMAGSLMAASLTARPLVRVDQPAGRLTNIIVISVFWAVKPDLRAAASRGGPYGAFGGRPMRWRSPAPGGAWASSG